jgi:hypothetical protein
MTQLHKASEMHHESVGSRVPIAGSVASRVFCVVAVAVAVAVAWFGGVQSAASQFLKDTRIASRLHMAGPLVDYKLLLLS